MVSPGRIPALYAGEPKHRSDYVGEILARRYGHANAIVAALLLFLETGVLLGIEEIRVRVEDAEHIGNRAIVDGFVGVDRSGVIMFDYRKNLGEAAVGVLEIAGAGASGTNRTAVKAAGNGRNSENADKKEKARAWVIPSWLIPPRPVLGQYSIQVWSGLTALRPYSMMLWNAEMQPRCSVFLT